MTSLPISAGSMGVKLLFSLADKPLFQRGQVTQSVGTSPLCSELHRNEGAVEFAEEKR